MSACPGCGLANYEGLCPVCRGDESAYREELEPFFGPFHSVLRCGECGAELELGHDCLAPVSASPGQNETR